MNKILVLIKKDNISFSIYKKKIEEEDINNTNVIDTKNLKFSESYIIDNMDLIASFFNLIVLKNDIHTAMIKNLEIAESILTLLKKIPKINKVIFTEDKEINYTLSSLLIDNHHLDKIECYSLPEIMFYRFKVGLVKTRYQILFKSDFMSYNHINTYSDLCSKDKIIIDNYLTYYDVDDILYFFKTNKVLKKIIIKGYNQNNLLAFLNMLKENHLKNITIIICEDEKTTKSILSDIPLFAKLNKKYNVNIKVKYSKEYKEKNKVKELNIIMFRNILLLIILFILLLIGLSKIKENNDNKNIKNINDNIEKIVDKKPKEKQNQKTSENKKISPYYQNYDLVYSKLLELNQDTVGWIQLKNTKINYPVVQAKDNEYYLNRAFDKSQNNAGWLFVDYRDNMDQLSQNIIIYGHNVKKNELMFGSLKNVLKESWNSNPNNLKINFNIKGTTYNFAIFSIYTTPVTDDYLITDFNSKQSFLEYINRETGRSIKNFGVEIYPYDRILTLSTCHNDSNHRLVVHAKMIG